MHKLAKVVAFLQGVCPTSPGGLPYSQRSLQRQCRKGAAYHENFAGVITKHPWLIGKIPGHDGRVILVENACDAIPPHHNCLHIVLKRIPASATTFLATMHFCRQIGHSSIRTSQKHQLTLGGQTLVLVPLSLSGIHPQANFYRQHHGLLPIFEHGECSNESSMPDGLAFVKV